MGKGGRGGDLIFGFLFWMDFAVFFMVLLSGEVPDMGVLLKYRFEIEWVGCDLRNYYILDISNHK